MLLKYPKIELENDFQLFAPVQWGLTINTKKPKVLVVGQNAETQTPLLMMLGV